MIDKVKKLYEKNPTVFITISVLIVAVLTWIISSIFRRPQAEQQAPQQIQRLPGVGVGLPTPSIPQAPQEFKVPEWLQEPPQWLGGLGKTIRDLVVDTLPAPTPTPTPPPPGREHLRDEGLIQRLEADIQRLTAKIQPITPPVQQRDEGLIQRLEADIQRVTARRQDPAVRTYFDREWGGIDGYLASQRERLGRAIRGDIEQAPQVQIQHAEPVRQKDEGLMQRLQADIARVEARRADPQARNWFAREWGGIDAYLASQRARLREAQR